MPAVVIDYDMSTRRFSVVQQEEVIGFRGTSPPANELDMNQTLVQLNEKDGNVHISESQTWKEFSGEYCCERREVVSHDGVSVPLTLLYSHTAWKKGQSPGLLHGYGAYGEVLDKSWCTDQLSLLDRGWVVAFADVRLVFLDIFFFGLIKNSFDRTDVHYRSIYVMMFLPPTMIPLLELTVSGWA